MRPREDRATAVADRPDEETPFPTFTNTTPTILTPPASGRRSVAADAPDRGTLAASSLDRRFDAVLTSALFDEVLAPSRRPANTAAAPIERPPLIDTAPKGGGGGGAGPDAAGGGGGNGAASARGGEIKPDGDAAVAAPNGARLSGTGADGEHIASGSEFSGSSESPVAFGDEYRLWTGIGTSVSGNVGDNDSVPAGSTFVVTDLPEVGDLQFSDDGSFSYTLQSDYHGGEDFFVYRLWSGGVSSTAWVRLDLSDDPPLAMDDEYLGALAGAAFTVSAAEGVLPNDIEYDGELVTGATLDTGPSHGSVALNSDGSFTYTADEDYYGWDSFTYICSDGKNFSQPATVTIGVNDLRIEGDHMIDDPNDPFEFTADVTDQTINREVGLAVELRAALVGPGGVRFVENPFLEGDGPTWSVPGITVKGYMAGTDPETGNPYQRVIPLAEEDKRGTVLTKYYWVDEGSGREVSVTAEIKDTNGKNLGTSTASVTFDVTRPQASVNTETDEVYVHVVPGAGWWAQFGDPWSQPTSPGIYFEETSGIDDSRLEWIQVIDSTVITYRKTLEGYYRNFNAAGVLDAINPFPKRNRDNSPTVETSATDSPGMRLGEDWSYLDRRDDFSMYLMYKPLGYDTIQVPLVKVDWFWQVRTSLAVDGAWVVDAGGTSNSVNPPAVNTYQYPQWNNEIGRAINQSKVANGGGELGAPMPT